MVLQQAGSPREQQTVRTARQSCRAESRRKPDIVLQAEGVPIHIFGVEHYGAQVPYLYSLVPRLFSHSMLMTDAEARACLLVRVTVPSFCLCKLMCKSCSCTEWYCLLLQPYIGEHILHERPNFVVVETAICPEHGAASGNIFTCSDLAPTSSFFERMFCQVSMQLAQMPEPGNSRLWQVSILAPAISFCCHVQVKHHSCIFMRRARVLSMMFPCYTQ